MPNLYVIILVAFVAFGSGWKAQGWHRDSLEKERAEQKLDDERLQAKANLRRAESVTEAQNRAATRMADLRRAADSARSELERLRSESDAAVTSARVSHEACVDRAAALNDVFKSCTGRYADVAEKADRHVSDIKTLTDSWPK